MKKREIKPALEALKKIRMPKIEDKALRNGIIKDHLAMLSAQRKLDDDLRDLDTSHFADLDEDREEVARLQEKLQLAIGSKDHKKAVEYSSEIAEHADYLAAVKAYNKDVAELMEQEVEIAGIPMEAFIEEFQKQDYDCGIVEALYPMFIIDNQ